MLGWLFVPVYMAGNVSTMPEYLRLRFGGVRIRVSLALLALLLYVFTKISSDLYAGAIFIEQSLKWNMYVSILVLLVVAAVFTITGGLTAVVWTDFVQTILMLAGAIALTIIGFYKVGGYQGMVEKYPTAIAKSALLSNSTCNMPREDYMHMFRDPKTGDLPWPGLAGVMINSLWYWCADQVIVQRALASRNLTHAKAGTVFAGFLKILPLFTLVFPGMIARILYPDTVACADGDTCYAICGSRAGCSNIAYPTLVLNLMPLGARGMMLAVMLAALMSSLTSIFNSSSTIFTIDIWMHIRKKASPREQMIVGRVFVLILVGVSILWVPIIKESQGTELFVYIQEISSFLQPPIIAVFMAGLFWSRANELGAFVGLVVGIGSGIIRFAIQYSFKGPTCEDPTDYRPAIVKDLHYLYFGTMLYFLTLIIVVVVSLLTKPIDKKHLYRLTFWTRHSKEKRIDLGSEEHTVSGTDEIELAVPEPNDKDLVEVKSKSFKTDLDKQVTETEEFSLANGDGQNDGELTEANSKSLEPDIIELTSDTESNKRPWYKTVLLWICGIDQTVTTTSHTMNSSQHTSLEEKRIWYILCNVSAGVLMAIGVFLFAFWA
ncbi:sodium/glucose cotransporter 4-like isoform X1 [Watersipora subatra]